VIELIERTPGKKLRGAGQRPWRACSLDRAKAGLDGWLGPNGAGKTHRRCAIVCTLLGPGQRAARSGAAGLDAPLRQPRAVRELLGYVPSEVATDKILTGGNTLELRGRCTTLNAKAPAGAESLIQRRGSHGRLAGSALCELLRGIAPPAGPGQRPLHASSCAVLEKPTVRH